LATFINYKRPNSETAILFLNYTVGQMSDREILDYDIPVRFQGANTAITKLIAHIRSPPEPGKPRKSHTRSSKICLLS